MKTEKGVTIAVFKNPENPRFAVLKRTKNWEGWETPKGHLEGSYRNTVKMELKEEAGIQEQKIKKIEDMDDTSEWEYERDGEEYHRKYRKFLVEVEEDTIISTDNNPHEEHSKGYFFRPKVAKEMLEYENNKELIEEALKHIKKPNP